MEIRQPQSESDALGKKAELGWMAASEHRFLSLAQFYCSNQSNFVPFRPINLCSVFFVHSIVQQTHKLAITAIRMTIMPIMRQRHKINCLVHFNLKLCEAKLHFWSLPTLMFLCLFGYWWWPNMLCCPLNVFYVLFSSSQVSECYWESIDSVGTGALVISFVTEITISSIYCSYLMFQ